MSQLTTYLRPVRVLLGDNDPDGIYAYEDQQLLDGLKTVVEFGRVPGYIIDGNGEVSPNLVAAEDAPNYMRLCLHTARLFVVERSRIAFNSRAFSESIGQPFELVDALINDIYQLDNGNQCL